ncbi:MAG: hypothetical protein WAU70_01840 [Flavobacteriales bacterium]
MKAYLAMPLTVIAFAAGSFEARAQWLNTAFGEIYCDPAITPQSVTIGDGTTVNEAALSVRSDELTSPPTSAAGYELFRTVVPSGQNGHWRAVRNTVDIGDIFTTATNTSFHVQAEDNTGYLWLQNSLTDGLCIAPDIGSLTVNGYTMSPHGFAALGDYSEILGAATNAPWSRLHLVHPSGGTSAVAPYRDYMRNGVLFTGNADMSYIGHRYKMVSGTEQSDESDLVINAGENSFSESTRQRIKFTPHALGCSVAHALGFLPSALQA